MYHYNYSFRLSPARQKSGIIFTDHKALIDEAIEAINGGTTFKQDRKCLVLNNLDDKEMLIDLMSQAPLANPARSLSALTRYLIANHPEIFEPYIYNKTLFNIHIISQNTTLTPRDDFSLSNEEIIKEIVDLLYTYPNSKEVIEAKAQITEILRPFVKKKN